MEFEYECALTGVVEPGGQSSDSDGLDDLPVGWTKIAITRRQYNPKWLLIQQVKDAMVEGLIQQFPPEMQDLQRYAVMVQVEAQFHGLEKDTPMYAADVEDVVYLSDTGEIVETINEFRDTLGLPVLPDEDEDEDEDDEIEEAAAEPEVRTPPELGDSETEQLGA